MIQVDWMWLERFNLFQVAVVIVALYVISRLLMRFWPWLRKVMALTEALGKLPAFMAITTATLAAQDVKIDEIHHETQYNNETSLKDSVLRAELGIKGIFGQLDALTESDTTQQERIDELERTQPPRRSES